MVEQTLELPVRRPSVVGILLGLAVGFLASATLASPSSATVGDLTPAGCFEQPDAGSPCVDVEGLVTPFGIEASPDGSRVRVADYDDVSVVSFDRGAGAGVLSPVGCLHGTTTTPGCSEEPGLAGTTPLLVATSPDSRSLYVTTDETNKLLHVESDPSTGVLTYEGCYAEAGVDLSCTSVLALGQAIDVEVSSDGSSVYVTTMDGDAGLAHFQRNAATGELTYVTCYSTSVLCAAGGAELRNGQLLSVSPDGKTVYVADSGGGVKDSLFVFDRASATGALTYRGCFGAEGATACTLANQTFDGEIENFSGAGGIDVAPDGTSVYVTAPAGDRIFTFQRAATGGLSFNQCFELTGSPGDCVEIDALDVPLSLSVSPDNRSVYVAARISQTVVGFDRDPLSGALTFEGCFEQVGLATSCADVEGLGQPEGLDVSSDGKSVYVTASASHSVVHFSRETSGDPPPPRTRHHTRRPQGQRKEVQKQKGKKIKIKVAAGAAEAITATASGKVKVGKKSYKLKPQSKQAAANQTTKLVLKPKKSKDAKKIAKAIKKFKKASGKKKKKLAVKAKLQVTAADAAANEQGVRRVVGLK